MAALNTPTLFVVLVCVSVTLGCLLFLSWLQNRSARAMLWWSSALLISAVAATLLSLRGTIADYFSIDVANLLLLIAYSCTFAGARRFRNAPVRWAEILVAPSGWFILCRFDLFYQSIELRVIAASMLISVLSLATALTLWRGRRERLMSRYPAVLVLGIHAAFFAVRGVVAVILLVPGSEAPAPSPWTGLLLFEMLLHIIAMSVLQIALIKERSELQQRTSALTDPLTGAPNRRALFEIGGACLAKCAAAQQPASLILIDIDLFKHVNDSFGHDAGDEVLRQICRTISEHLRLDDVFGRLGGEEFACVLPSARIESAMAVAEGLRLKIGSLNVQTEVGLVKVAISCGLAEANECKYSMIDMLKKADARLYAAKAAGRNCVVGRDPVERRESRKQA